MCVFMRYGLDKERLIMLDGFEEGDSDGSR